MASRSTIGSQKGSDSDLEKDQEKNESFITGFASGTSAGKATLNDMNIVELEYQRTSEKSSYGYYSIPDSELSCNCDLLDEAFDIEELLAVMGLKIEDYLSNSVEEKKIWN